MSTTHPFTLQAYEAEHVRTPFAVRGSLTYEAPWLVALFTVQGPVSELLLPHQVQTPERQDRLWEHTCFELFFAVPYSERYWEVNVAPSGNWNTYGFEAYRQGMYAEPLLCVEQVASHRPSGDVFTLQFHMHMVPLQNAYSLAPGMVETSPCCILVDHAQQKSYWAMHHQPPRPDFHRRASFVLPLFLGNHHAARP